MCGSNTWLPQNPCYGRSQRFVNKCLRIILRIWWLQTISNEALWERTNQEPIEHQIRRRKWSWIGHILRKPTRHITRQSVTWNPRAKGKGEGQETAEESEMSKAEYKWKDLEAQNRVRWKGVVDGLRSPGE